VGIKLRPDDEIKRRKNCAKCRGGIDGIEYQGAFVRPEPDILALEQILDAVGEVAVVAERSIWCVRAFADVLL
jgi:hypothetical protein